MLESNTIWRIIEVERHHQQAVAPNRIQLIGIAADLGRGAAISFVTMIAASHYGSKQ